MNIFNQKEDGGYAAEKRIMKDFPLIEITAGTPFERGVQYGEQAKKWIDIAVAHYYDRFAGEGHSRDSLDTYAMGFVPVIEKMTPDYLEEAKGIAHGSSRSLEEIMVVNCRYEISKFPKENECTTVALLPEATKDGKTYIVKNWDYSVQIMDHIVMLRVNTPEFRGFGMTEAGQMVRDGVNSSKVGFVNNNLQSVKDHPGTGLPVTFIRKGLWECDSFEKACDFVASADRCVSCNTLIAAEGKARDFEAYPGGANVIEPEKGILTHANHFVMNEELDAITNRPKNRDTRLKEILMMKHGEITLDYLMTCMRDHKYHHLSVCSHPNEQGDGYERNRITVSSMIANLTDGEVWVCLGPPCLGEYKMYTI